ncbi:hypothetical protein GCM10009425_17000 [Pseudomonas asuensis]|uniref:DUF4878 domain-containing protein n=1 Tax=Pseudomonas asuensis TaxID=1825787 RepID=A0ABQ2GPE0_9PSED|nr:DUF4878 domain-containing protein [Pseudomonas asuensis]GGM06297.1 hypothetical protein GCM10009425_17000 [Pseudomonas asuensis]
MFLIKRWFALIFIASFLAACSDDNTPESVAERFIKAAYAQDLDTMMDLIDVPKDADANAKGFVRGKFQMVLTEKAKQAESLGGIKNIKAEEPTYNDDKTHAHVSVTVTFNKDGKTHTEKTNLIQSNGNWKIEI